MVLLDTDLLERTEALSSRVGDTPLVPLHHLLPGRGVELWAKQEWKQFSGSVKCRAAYFIVRGAVRRGQLGEGKALLDATSGNTGIAYAALGAELGIPVTLCLPENASRERKEILRSLGAEVILTSRFEGTDGAQEKARELARRNPGRYFYADQYRNENNWKAHYETTAPEIIEALPRITHFIAGLGTTGTFTGTTRRLKEFNPAIRSIALQPDLALHGLEGWKHLPTACVPAIYDPTLPDEQRVVGTEEAYALIRRYAGYDGELLSPSAAANLAGALKLAEELEQGVIVTVLPDNADKYSDIIKQLI